MSLSVSRHPSSPFTASSSHRVTRSKTYIPASEVGTPICIPSRDFIDIGRIASIENNHTPVDYAKKGLKGAIKNVEVFMDAFRAVIEESIGDHPFDPYIALLKTFGLKTNVMFSCPSIFFSQFGYAVVKNTCVSVDKFFVMIKDLDISRRKADLEGHTTRADGLRSTSLQHRYHLLLSPFLQIATFSEPKSKLEIVVHYLWKYMTKPSVHTRKSNGCPEDATFEVALKCFSNKTGTKSTIKKIGPDVMQFLVGHS
ncbi:hypothetical protein Ahy_B06g080458 isoform A [Arachis hypogaea]|uniref:Uncharacterized protein n=1 Tax=Arachis hypogaea TaxID=3818 RepID=A0A444YHZ3_ARAHY|nr:hypothetical protein Ahy_B06g080458 isoform A [Arachis hypogaea]